MRSHIEKPIILIHIEDTITMTAMDVHLHSSLQSSRQTQTNSSAHSVAARYMGSLQLGHTIFSHLHHLQSPILQAHIHNGIYNAMNKDHSHCTLDSRILRNSSADQHPFAGFSER